MDTSIHYLSYITLDELGYCLHRGRRNDDELFPLVAVAVVPKGRVPQQTPHTVGKLDDSPIWLVGGVGHVQQYPFVSHYAISLSLP